MANFPSMYLREQYGLARAAFDDAILSALGVVHRRKRYSRVFYINADTSIGKDINPVDSAGNCFDTPLLTLAAALSHCESGRGDFIIVVPSGTNFTEEDVSVALADLTIVGLDDAKSMLYGLKPNAAVTAAILALTAAADNVMLKNLLFNSATGLRSGITTASGTDYFKCTDCCFVLTGAAAADIGYGINMSAGASISPIIARNLFVLNTEIQDAIQMKAGSTGGIIAENEIICLLNGSGTGPVTGIHLAAGTGVRIHKNRIHGGDTGTAYNMGTGILIDAGVKNTLITGPNEVGDCDTAITDSGTDSIGVVSGVTTLANA